MLLISLVAPPQWVDEIRNITTSVGSSIHVTCKASGLPKPVVKLQKLSGINIFYHITKLPL